MRYARIVVFMLGVGTMSAAVLQPMPASQAQVTLEQVQGRGLLDVLTCGGCLGSGALAAATGWGAFWTAAMSVGDGALASACVEACLSAF